MRRKKIFEKILVMMLILSLSLSSISVAAEQNQENAEPQTIQEEEKEAAPIQEEEPSADEPEAPADNPGEAEQPAPSDEPQEPEAPPVEDENLGGNEAQPETPPTEDENSGETKDEPTTPPTENENPGGNEEQPTPPTEGENLGEAPEQPVTPPTEEQPGGNEEQPPTPPTEEEQPDNKDDVTTTPPAGEGNPGGSTNTPATPPTPPTGEENSGELQQTPAELPSDDVKQEAPLPEERPKEKPVEPIDYHGLRTFDELLKVAFYEVAATMEASEIALFAMSDVGEEQEEDNDWTFNTYYVNEDDSNDTEKTQDFSLKYQMSFHTSQDLSERSVEIRIKESLLNLRDNGGTIVPGEGNVAVPFIESKDADPISRNDTPFNYYIEGEGEDAELVFFNYRAIPAGTNAAWQVLYKNIKLMTVEDASTWELQPEITVTIPGEEGEEDKKQTQKVKPLTGRIDSSVSLSSVSKVAYNDTDKNYTPGLYTPSQVGAYIEGGIDNIPEDFYNPEETDRATFNQWKFTVWEVKISGTATQPWSLSVQDFPKIEGMSGGWMPPIQMRGIGMGGGLGGMEPESIGGRVVGYRDNSDKRYGYNVPIHAKEITDENGNTITQLVARSEEESWKCRFYVVTAVPADDVHENTTLNNKIGAILHPLDKVDPVQTKDSDASWTYEDYDWSYQGELYDVQKKTADKEVYKGWLEAYKRASDNNKDYGDIPFTTSSVFRGYSLTHYTESFGEHQVGDYIQGTQYKLTTADDFMYVQRAGTALTESQMLTGGDYYFTGVAIRQSDVGYDVWEDTEAEPETAADVDQSVKIYAMFADSDTWEEVAYIPWEEYSKIEGKARVFTYEFPSEVLAKEPWRVKVEHATVNYRTECKIDVKVRFRYNSLKMQEAIADYKGDGEYPVIIKDSSAIIPQVYNTQTGNWEYSYMSKMVHNNYSEPGLKEATKALYGITDADAPADKEFPVYRRETADKTVTGLEKEAYAYKRSKSTNDVNSGRALVDFYLTAYDGYNIYNQETVDYLSNHGITSPGRNEVVFYDLLPYGMRFDPSSKVTAGRITNITENRYQTQPKVWDPSQVSVTIDSKNDIIENYNGTGRTMLIFHVKYSGADSAVYTDGHWMEGWGVSFRAYYDWKDKDIVQEGANISAFMTDTEDPHYAEPLCGTEKQVAKDNGTIVPNDDPVFVKSCEAFKNPGREGGIDGNTGNDEVLSVLYAREEVKEDIVTTSGSDITKQVRADADRFGDYSSKAIVVPEGKYTYHITISAKEKDLGRIVVFDRLEAGEQNSWHGTFDSVITSGLKEMGIVPVVYFNEKRVAEMLPENESISDDAITTALTTDKGWYLATALEKREDGWYEIATDKKFDVQAIAVDMKPADGKNVILTAGHSASFQIKMTAPAMSEADGKTDATNSPYYYSRPADAAEGTALSGSPASVSLKADNTLEVIKEFKGNIPSAVKDSLFRFTLYEKDENAQKKVFAFQEYTLWKYDTALGWVEQTDGLHATTKDGYLELKAGEKAVFEEVPDAGRIIVEEKENIFWKSEKTDLEASPSNNQTRTVTFTNSYRPVLYVQKGLEGVPADVEVSEYEFTFKIETYEGGKWIPLTESEFYYVDQVRTDGGIPTQIANKKGKTGPLVDSEGVQILGKGEFKIKAGEIIALFPGKENTQYRVTEVAGANGSNDDWVCQKTSVEGTLFYRGAQASILNYYRYKDLYLKKEITHQTQADWEAQNQAFTFQILMVTKGENGEEKLLPVTTRNTWTLLSASGAATKSAGSTGTLDAEGYFTCACAGKTVIISGLEAGKTYVIKETDSGELYRPVNDSQEVTMPVYSSKKDVTFVNDWLKRPLSVSKTVVYNPEGMSAEEIEALNAKAFTMRATIKGMPLKQEDDTGYPYTVTEQGKVVEGDFKTDPTDGSFTLKNGQTATFKDVGILGDSFQVIEVQDAEYGQIYPENIQEGHIGTLEGDGAEVSFINGNADNYLFISKEYVGEGTKAEDYVARLKETYRVSGEMGGETYYNDTDTAKVEISLTIDGKIYNWREHLSEGDYTVINQVTGESLDRRIDANDTSLTLAPWHTVMIDISKLPNVSSDTRYTVWESEKNQHRLLTVDNSNLLMEQYESWTSEERPRVIVYEINQKYPKDDQAFTGRLQNDRNAKIVNEVKEVTFEKSDMVFKGMTSESAPVPENAKLVWRLEEYDTKTQTWIPKEGVSYLTGNVYMEGKRSVMEVSSNKIKKTGANGEIVLFKSNSFQSEKCNQEFLHLGGEGSRIMPAVNFLDTEVHLNVYSKPNGTALRLVEVPEKSDEEWGMLAGYLASKNAGNFGPNVEQWGEFHVYGMTIAPELTMGFVNSNQPMSVEVAKEMSVPTDEQFTMILKQVMSASANPITSEEQITASEARQGIPYVVYDAKTNTIKKEHELTGRNGEILLRAGEYARLQLPQETLWTVTEDVPRSYNLTQMTGTPDGNRQLTVLRDDKTEKVMLINQKAEKAPLTIRLASEKLISGGHNGIPNPKEVYVGDKLEYRITVQNTSNKELSGVKVTDVLPDGVKFESAFRSDRDTGLEGKPEDNEYSLGKLSSGEEKVLSITVIVTKPGDLRNVASVVCTEWETPVKSNVVHTEAVAIEEIAITADMVKTDGCVIDKNGKRIPLTGDVIIPEYIQKDGKVYRVTSIGSFAFGGYPLSPNMSLTSIYIPDSVTMIGESAFQDCNKLICVTGMQNIEEIGFQAFSRCKSLIKVLLPEKPTIIKGSAFLECTALEDIDLSHVTTIPEWGFQQCFALTEVNLENVVTIGSGAFASCRELQTVRNLNKVESIEDKAFAYCSKLTSLEGLQSLKTIGNRIIRQAGVNKIELPSTVTTIHSTAFNGANSLQQIIIHKNENAISGAPWDAPKGASIVQWVGEN